MSEVPRAFVDFEDADRHRFLRFARRELARNAVEHDEQFLHADLIGCVALAQWDVPPASKKFLPLGDGTNLKTFPVGFAHLPTDDGRRKVQFLIRNEHAGFGERFRDLALVLPYAVPDRRREACSPSCAVAEWLTSLWLDRDIGSGELTDNGWLWRDLFRPSLRMIDAAIAAEEAARPDRDASSQAESAGTDVEAPPVDSGRKRWLSPAMLTIRDHPEWSDSAVADHVGVHRSTLCRSPEYQVAKRLARSGRTGLMRHGYETVDAETGLRDVVGLDESDHMDLVD